MNQYICIIEKWSLRLAKGISAQASSTGNFFFVFYENASWLNCHFLKRKSQTCRRGAPGVPHYLRHADATLFTRKSSLQWRPVVHSVLIQSRTDSRIEAAFLLCWVKQEACVQTPGLATTVDTQFCHGCRLTARWNLILAHKVNSLKSYSSSVFLCDWPVRVWPVGTGYSWRDMDEGC